MEPGREAFLHRLNDLVRDNSYSLWSIRWMSLGLVIALALIFIGSFWWYSIKRDTQEIKGTLIELRQTTANVARGMTEIRKYHLNKNLKRL